MILPLDLGEAPTLQMLPLRKHHPSSFWSSWWKPGSRRQIRHCITLILRPAALLAPTQPLIPWQPPWWLLHPCPAPEGFTRELQFLVSPSWGAQGPLILTLLKSASIHSSIYYSPCNQRQETGVGGNPRGRRGMEKENCRAWC